MIANSVCGTHNAALSIDIKDISFSYEKNIYEKNNILTHFSLALPIGKRTALLAPSGWGKTTLLFLIAGLLKPESGQISYPMENPAFSMVFQENRLIENSSIRQNLSLVSNHLTTTQLQEALNAVGLNYPSAKKVRALSGGEKRRISILRALCADYDILLMDEPFTGLDDDTKQKVIDHIIHKTEGKTVILVTHNASEAEALGCDIIQLASIP